MILSFDQTNHQWYEELTYSSTTVDWIVGFEFFVFFPWKDWLMDFARIELLRPSKKKSEKKCKIIDFLKQKTNTKKKSKSIEFLSFEIKFVQVNDGNEASQSLFGESLNERKNFVRAVKRSKPFFFCHHSFTEWILISQQFLPLEFATNNCYGCHFLHTYLPLATIHLFIEWSKEIVKEIEEKWSLWRG